MSTEGTSPLREAFMPILTREYGDDAIVLMRRIEARLDGYSHAEAAQMHPLPGDDRA